MPAYSKSKRQQKVNLVRERPGLPSGLVYSDITINYSFQSLPTVTVKAEGIKEEDFESVRKNHKLASKVNLFGIDYEVSQFGWTKEKIPYKDEVYIFYSINVNYSPTIKRKLEGGIKVKNITSSFSHGSAAYNGKKSKTTKPPKISIQKLCAEIKVPYSGPEALVPIPEDKESEINVGSVIQEIAHSKGCYIEYGDGVKLLPWESPSGQVAVADEDIFEDGENTETFPPTYNGVELSWDREDEEAGAENTEEEKEEPDPSAENKELPPRYNFVRVQSKIQTLTEEDVDYTEPPKDTKVLRDMSSLFWESGPTRKCQKSVLHDGTEIQSELTIYGFSYQVKDLVLPDGLLFSDNPAQYWRVCERNKTNRIYEPIGNINLKITGINKANKRNVRLVLHPDYKNLGKISTFASDGYLFSFQPKVEYLTAINSIGYKLMPLEKEPGSGQTLADAINPDENPRAKVQIPFEIPKEDHTAYKLGAARSYYRQEEQNQNLPFQVEFSTFRELPRYLQDAVRWQMGLNLGPDDLVGIVTPDPNYVESLVVLTESRTTNSFMYAADPDSAEDDPKPPLISGEEGYFRLDRTILNADKYRESITEYTATDPGYRSSLTISRIAEKSGQAPQAESRQIKYDKKENQDYWDKRSRYQYTFKNPNQNKDNKNKNLPRYFVDSDLQNEGIPTSGNLSFPYARSLGEALKAAKAAIEIEHCQNAGTHNKSASWFFPDIRDGQRVAIDGANFRVLSLSVSIEQVGSGVIKPIGGFVQLTPGTKVVLGPEVPRLVTSYQSTDNTNEDPMEEALNPDQGSTGVGGDGEVRASFIGGETELGDVLEPDSTRRKF